MNEIAFLEKCLAICDQEGKDVIVRVVGHLAGIEWDINEYLNTREEESDEITASLAALRISLGICMVWFRIGQYDLNKYLNGKIGGDRKRPLLDRYAEAYSEEQRNSDGPLKLFVRRCLAMFFLLKMFNQTGDVSRDALLQVIGDLRLGEMELICRFKLDHDEIEDRIDDLLGGGLLENK